MTAAMRTMPAPVLRLVNEDGSLGSVLPGWTSVSIGGDLGEQLVLSLTYRTDHSTYALLDDQAEVAVTVDGAEIPDGRFIIDELTDEEVLDQDVVPRGGNSTLFHLNYALVYPESWTLGAGNVSTPGHGFANQTPGQALRELLELAQARGWMPDLTWDFTDGLDSSGAAWQPSISEFCDQGTSLLDVVTKWKTRKLAVARMNGGVLQLFTYATCGVDRALDIQLFRDVDLSEGPVQRTSRNTVSVILGVSDAVDGPGFGVERTSNPALSKYGRREGFVSQTQVPDMSTLTSIVDGTLALKARQREAFTYGLTCSHPKRLPLIHWDRGDLVTLRVAGQDRVMRARQLTVEWDKDGQATGSAAFGDRKMDVDEQLAQRLEQLSGGSLDGGVFGPPIVGYPDTSAPPGAGGTSPDTMPPAAPTGLAASSTPVFQQGYLSATSVVTWAAPTTNADGSALQDLSGYEVQFRMGTGGNWQVGGRTDKDTLQFVLQRLNVQTVHQVRVRARDIWSNASAWAQLEFTTTNDTVPPVEQPSAPAVSPFLFAGLLITWDGLANGGTAIDNDIRHVEVHVSTVNNFVPSAGTLKDRIDIGGGSTVVGELTPGTTYYVRFKSVDWAGNPGPVGPQTTGVPDAVGTADLGNGAVTDAKLTSVSATKITAGTMSAVVTLSGEFRTAASGQRVVTNAAGIKMYDSSGNVQVSLPSDGTQASFNGVLGAMIVGGYVRVDSGAGPFLVMQNLGGVPTLALSSGRLIEKYPAYLYQSSSAVGRSLSTRINAPGSAYAGSDGTNYDYSQIEITTYVYDGDYANATVLPTAMYGMVRFSLPAGSLSGDVNGRHPSIRVQSRWNGSTDPSQYHLAPAVVWQNGAVDRHEAGIRIDGLGSGSDNVQLSVVKSDGGSWCAIKALSFPVGSGRSLKTDISDLPYSALQVVLDNPSLRWRYRQDPDKPSSFTLGPMGDDLPLDLRHVNEDDPSDISVNVNAMVGLLWRAIEEQQEMIRELQERMEAA